MSSGVPTTAFSTCVKSLALKTLMPLNSNPLTTGASGSAGGVAAAAVVDAGAGVVEMAVGGGTAAGAAVVAALGGVSGAAWAGSVGGVGAANRTQLIFLSLLSKGLGMAGLTGLGGYCTHWSKAAGCGWGRCWALGRAGQGPNQPPQVQRMAQACTDPSGQALVCGLRGL